MDSDNKIIELNEIGITDATKHHLILKIASDKLWYATQGENSFVGNYVELPLALSHNTCKAVEEACYSTPLPGNDFKSVTVMVDNDRFMTVPDDYLNDNPPEPLISAAFGNDETNRTLVLEKIPYTDATLIWTIDTQLQNFMLRTFYNATFSHSMLPVIVQSMKRARLANSPRLTMTFDNDCVKVVASRDNRLIMANRFVANDTDSILYYTLAVWRECGFDAKSAELHINGNSNLRDNTLKALKDYIRFVLPDIYPPQLSKISTLTTQYPYDMMLKLMMICE